MEKTNYYQVLGLEPTATAAEIEASYLSIVKFLDSNEVPQSLRRWAAAQSSAVDEAYAALTEAGEEGEEDEEDDVVDNRRTAAPSRKAQGHTAVVSNRPQVARRSRVEEEEFDDDEVYEELEDEIEDRPARRQPAAQTAGRLPAQTGSGKTLNPRQGQAGSRQTQGMWQQQGRGRGRAAGSEYSRPRRRAKGADDRGNRILLGAIAGAFILLLGYLVVQSGFGPFSGGTDQAPPFDQARYQQLKNIVAKDPSNAAALFELGQITFEADRFEESISWLEKELKLQPNDVQALQDVGTANFNLGNRAKAIEMWQRALAVDPDNQQTHWNLSFYYATEQPQNLELAITEWKKVIELDPASNLGKLAKSHLDQYDKGSQGTGSGSPTPGP